MPADPSPPATTQELVVPERVSADDDGRTSTRSRLAACWAHRQRPLIRATRGLALARRKYCGGTKAGRGSSGEVSWGR